MQKLQTKRLNLRKIREDDAAQIFNGWANDKEVTKYLTWHPHESVESVKQLVCFWLDDYKKENCYRYGIELLGTDDLIGMIDVVGYDDGVPEIGFVLARAHWNKGYMSEALKSVTTYLFAEGFAEIYIQADARNIGRNRVIEKCGFKFLHTKDEPSSAGEPESVTLNCYRKFSA